MTISIVLLLGVSAGVLSSLLGVGGGIILVPGMMFLLKIPTKIAIGTSLAIIIPTAVIGVYRHSINGNVDWKITFLISLGAIAGAYLGTLLNDILPEVVLRKIFVLLLIVMAIKIWRG